MSFLVPVDLTAPSFAAIEIAVLLGRALGEEAILLHVSQGRPPLDLLAALYELARPLRQASVVTRLRTVQGTPAEMIPAEAIRRKCKWVVMGTRGVLDSPHSVAGAVMARSQVPVLAVRPGETMGNYAGVYLCSSSRSQAPWAWDVAGLLAASAGTRVIHVANPACSDISDRCSEDALMILDVTHMPEHVLADTLHRERCSVVLITRPTLSENTHPPV